MVYRTIAIAFLFIYFVALERWRPYQKRPVSSLKENLILGFTSFLFTFAIFKVLAVTLDFPKLQLDTPLLLPTLATIPLLDFVSYIWHRSTHYFNFLWRLHRVHHSDHTLETSSSVRFHFIETSLSLIPRWGCILFCELPLSSVFIFEAVFQASNFFQHANIQLPGRLEKILSLVLVTPSMHRKHHSLIINEQNSNFSTIFSIWDRIFRTYRDNFAETVQTFGLSEMNTRLNWRQLLLLPIKDPSLEDYQ
ncbi:MAG: sterol desaturase family protein [Bdellovibrionaceae bacterium]|nr:sterol desaturase family protein [Pseudobdellovibrionaceae bacterium]